MERGTGGLSKLEGLHHILDFPDDKTQKFSIKLYLRQVLPSLALDRAEEKLTGPG